MTAAEPQIRFLHQCDPQRSFSGALWLTLMTQTLMSFVISTASDFHRTVPTFTVVYLMGNCTYGHQPPTILYLQAKFQIQIYCTS